MIVIPSMQVEPDSSRSYANGVSEVVQSWERDGFTRMQLALRQVDRSQPAERVLEEVLRDVQCAVQVSGRFDTTEDIDSALETGAGFIVLGSRALDELDWLSSVAGRFPGQLLLSTPARERRARTRGTLRTLPLDLRDLAAEIGGAPLAGILVEFAHDAVIGHSELALLEDVVEEVEFTVQVSGASPDLATLRDLEFRGVGGVIIDAAHLSAGFDGQTIARSFTD
jgi:phosphoribosylformimino-5-aminoimidazole carboxamide ribonucleotide (ProFAR) isomerase